VSISGTFLARNVRVTSASDGRETVRHAPNRCASRQEDIDDQGAAFRVGRCVRDRNVGGAVELQRGDGDAGGYAQERRGGVLGGKLRRRRSDATPSRAARVGGRSLHDDGSLLHVHASLAANRRGPPYRAANP